MPLLQLEPLEAREVPAAVGFVGGWGSSMYQYAASEPAAAGIPTDQFALNFAKIEFDRSAPPPASDYLLTLDGIKGESSAARLVIADQRDFDARESGGALSPTPPPPQTASDFLLKLEGIKGESGDGHRETIEIVSWSLGAPAPVADDVVVDGRIITAENFDAVAPAAPGCIRVQTLNSGG